jgi:hypothetical protein
MSFGGEAMRYVGSASAAGMGAGTGETERGGGLFRRFLDGAGLLVGLGLMVDM